MKNNKYWEKRAAKTMYEQMVDVEKTADVMSKAFHRAAVELEKEMQHIFSTFQGELTEKQARDLLEKADSIDFGNLMDLYNKLPDSPAKEAILKQLNSPAYKARIARLEQLAKDVEKKSKELYGVQIRQISSVLKDTVSESYYRSVFDIQKNIGFSYEFARMNERNIDVILSRPWSGKHYSERIWGNTEKLTNVLKEELLVGFMTGKSYREMADVVMKEMASGAMDARRLVRTEANFVANQGHKEAYEDAEIEKYQFVGTLDNRTSPMCQELDGKIFPLEKAKVGVNYPPIHPWCRSTTVAYFDDEDDELVKKLRKRRARDPETGKAYLVPVDTTYEQWKKGLEGEGKWCAYKGNSFDKNTKVQYQRYLERLGADLGYTEEEFVKLKKSNSKEWNDLQLKYRYKGIDDRIAENYPEYRMLKIDEGVPEEYSEQALSLPEEDKTVVYHYTDGGEKCAAINKHAATGEFTTEEAVSDCKELERILKGMSLPHDTVVYRGTKVERIIGLQTLIDNSSIGDWKKQKIFIPSFASTSVFRDTVYKSEVELTILIPKEKKGAGYVNDIAHHHLEPGFSDEYEVVLQKGSCYTIVEAQYYKGKLFLCVKYSSGVNQ